MDLFLIRHAEAVDRKEFAGKDEERPLTETGQAQAKGLGTGLSAHKVRLDLLLTSPLVRAQQTAQGMLEGWKGPVPELRVCEDLAPGARRKKLARFLRALGVESVGLVGHMPDLGEFTAWLLGDKSIQMDLAKAGVVHVRCDQPPDKGAAALVWMITPEWLDS
jgi:phosphohistidine phosphatase